MAKINILGLAPPDDKRYKEGYSIAVQPTPEELKRAAQEYKEWVAAGRPKRTKQK